jgi:4-diphosphocytidyl-2-C-methyl-D-erythritol kinase
LTLHVLGQRPDGYHDVEMVMQAIDLHDLIILREKTETGIEIRCDHPFVPCNPNNLAYRAAELLMKEKGAKSGLVIEIIKKIPVAAGLAGGSTDAAAVLIGLNQLWDLGYSREELMKIGGKLGADVPFCIMGGTALATGTGTDLRPMSSAPEMEIVMVTPEIAVSTKDVYSRYTPDLVKQWPDLASMERAIWENDVNGIRENLANVLEPITLHYYPQVGEAKRKMEETGLHPVVMSGSGPTLFAIMDSKEIADRLAEKLSYLEIGRVIRTRTRSLPALEERSVGDES